MSSTFGERFRITTFGESHGGGVGVVVDGCPAQMKVDVADIQAELDRRRPGQSRLTTQRDEADEVEVLSGILDGVTLGTPLAMVVRNTDAKPGAYDHLADVYRPSHADFTTQAKYGIRAVAGGGRSSARETVGRVAAGAVARAVLEAAGVTVVGWVASVRDIVAEVDTDAVSRTGVDAHPTRCPDAAAAAQMADAITAARADGDSLGGVVACVARGVPAGLGEPVFDKLDAQLAKGLMSLPAAKGVEVGSGFGATLLTGSEHNDSFIVGEDGPALASNNSGGIQGGISNGAPITLRVAFKPTATIAAEQHTVTTANEPTVLAARGRHDPCVLPRAVPMVEAMVCLVLADALLLQQTTHLRAS